MAKSSFFNGSVPNQENDTAKQYADAAAASAAAADISKAACDADLAAVQVAMGHQSVAGAGLTGGGSLFTGDVTFNVGAGTGISVAADAVNLKPAALAEIGGVNAIASVSHKWVAAINTDGTVTLTQPAFSDISGSVSPLQLPPPQPTSVGAVKSAGPTANQWVASINTDGSVTLTQPSFSNISGSVAASQMPAHTGDVTSTAGTVALTIASNVVTNAKAAQMAAGTLKGNNTGSTANASDLTATQTTAMLNAMVGANGTTGGTKGLVPAPAATDNVKFLRGDGTFATPAGGGNVTGPATSTNKAAARYSGTGGTALLDSALLIDDTTGRLSRSGNGGIPVQGTNTNDNAAAGDKGESIVSSVPSGSAVALTSVVKTNVTSISLTAGDWDVDCWVDFTGGASTNISAAFTSISTTSALLDLSAGRYAALPVVSGGYTPFVGSNDFAQALPPIRLSLSATTTVYLVVQVGFTVSTCSAWGIISARRVR